MPPGHSRRKSWIIIGWVFGAMAVLGLAAGLTGKSPQSTSSDSTTTSGQDCERTGYQGPDVIVTCYIDGGPYTQVMPAVVARDYAPRINGYLPNYLR